MRRLESDAAALPTLTLVALVGLSLGTFFRVRRAWVPMSLGASAVLATVKLAIACPTCPVTTVLGLDSAVVAVVFFLGLTGLSLSRARFRDVGVLLAISGALVWQTVAWWEFKGACVPCAGIGFLLGLLLASFPSWAAEPFVRPSRRLSVGMAALAAPAVIFAGASPALTPIPPARTLTALGRPREPKITRISDLGLAAPARRIVVYVGAKGCPACVEASETLRPFPELKVDYRYVGKEPPEEDARWRPVPVSAPVFATPLLLLVEPNGQVTRQIAGFRDDPVFRTELVNDLLRFTTAPKKRP